MKTYFTLMAFLLITCNYTWATEYSRKSLVLGDVELQLISYDNGIDISRPAYTSDLIVIDKKSGKKREHYKGLHQATGLVGFNHPPVAYFEKVGGSGGGAGIYRYIPAKKKLDLFEPEKTGKSPMIEIFEYKDINNDGNPELFTVSRSYDDNHNSNYYHNVYEWLPEEKKPKFLFSDE